MAGDYTIVVVDDLMEIGRFAAQSGLTVQALRQHDDVGLLTPAEVNPQASYRRYRPGHC